MMVGWFGCSCTTCSTLKASARPRNEPAGQIAAREMEIVRISTALRRADELDDDVTAAIEMAAGPPTSRRHQRLFCKNEKNRKRRIRSRCASSNCDLRA